MTEGASGNPDAAQWPNRDEAAGAVRRMHVKLHRWAGEERSHRFGDLFNLVYDPAFLVHAAQRPVLVDVLLEPVLPYTYAPA